MGSASVQSCRVSIQLQDTKPRLWRHLDSISEWEVEWRRPDWNPGSSSRRSLVLCQRFQWCYHRGKNSLPLERGGCANKGKCSERLLIWHCMSSIMRRKSIIPFEWKRKEILKRAAALNSASVACYGSNGCKKNTANTEDKQLKYTAISYLKLHDKNVKTLANKLTVNYPSWYC